MAYIKPNTGDSIRDTEYYGDRYERFGLLMGYFHMNSIFPDKPVKEIINQFVNVTSFNKEIIFQTIKECKFILKLKSFPLEWVTNYANRYFKDIDDCKKWIELVSVMLEEEAKKAGKL